MSEFVKVRKDEWEQHRKDVELFIQRYKESIKKVRDLTKENTMLKEKLQSSEERLVMSDKKAASDLEETSMVIHKIRADISRVLQQTEKEMGKG